MSKKAEVKAERPTFAGVGPYLDEAAKGHDIPPEIGGKAAGTWHAKRVQNSLASVVESLDNPEMSDADRGEIFMGAVQAARSLVALAEGCAAAVSDVAAMHGGDAKGVDVAGGAKSLASAIAQAKADRDAAEADAAKAISDARSEADKLRRDLQAALADLAEARAEADRFRADLDKAKAKPAEPPNAAAKADPNGPARVDPKPHPPSK